jgi:heat shock protein HslJ
MKTLDGHCTRIATSLAAMILGLGVAGAADPSLVGKWRIVEIVGAEPFDAAKTAFEVDADGRVGSTIGCNRVVGKPSLDGDRLKFGPMAATRMACPPPLDRLEMRYLAALEAVRSLRTDGARVTLIDRDGQAVVTLERAE